MSSAECTPHRPSGPRTTQLPVFWTPVLTDSGFPHMEMCPVGPASAQLAWSAWAQAAPCTRTPCPAACRLPGPRAAYATGGRRRALPLPEPEPRRLHLHACLPLLPPSVRQQPGVSPRARLWARMSSHGPHLAVSLPSLLGTTHRRTEKLATWPGRKPSRLSRRFLLLRSPFRSGGRRAWGSRRSLFFLFPSCANGAHRGSYRPGRHRAGPWSDVEEHLRSVSEGRGGTALARRSPERRD